MGIAAKGNKRTLIYKTVFIVAIVEPLVALPQLYEIYANKSAGSVSLLSWTLYTFTGAIWLLYGISIKDKPLIITSSLNVAAELAVVAAILVY